MKKHRSAKIFILGFFLAAIAKVLAGDVDHAGFIYDGFPLVLTSGHRTEAAGPFFYFDEQDSQKIWGFPPLCWLLKNPATELTKFDLAYPVLTYHRYGTEYRWQLCQLLSIAGGNQKEQAAKRFTIFPIYFSQRSADTNLNYTAVLPFYGHLQNRIFTDELFFIMFPLYFQSQKSGVVTDHYLFPLVHTRRGEALEGWSVLPFAGHEHKEPTWHTNGFGDVEIVPGHDNQYVLMPFYLRQDSGIGTTNPVTEVASLPFFSRTRSPVRDSTTVAWPFFTHVTDREKGYSEWETPWPLIVFARGNGKTTSRVWPFFSQAHNATQRSEFYLWPIYLRHQLEAETVERKRTRIALFLYSDTCQKNKETGKFRERRDLWPIFTHNREFNGGTRLQVLAPLEPVLPFSDSVEREYSPVWSLWRAEKNPETGAASQSFLWNLYRRDTAPGVRKCSLLFGLFQYQSTPEGRRVRLFYLPISNESGPGAKQTGKTGAAPFQAAETK